MRITSPHLILLLSVLGLATGYPVIFQVDEGGQRCFRFNVHEDDDANLVGLVLPSEEELGSDAVVEKWYIDQIHKMIVRKGDKETIQKDLPDEMPSNVAQKMSQFMQESSTTDRSGLFLQITGTPGSDPNNFHQQQMTKYFDMLVINYLGRSTDAMRKLHMRDEEEGNLEGYGVCLTNRDEERAVQVLLDIVMVSEVVYDESVDDSNRFLKDEHLTPLERSLDASISSANTILREMQYMEKREQRMRRTAESINTRVRWFSYLSVSVLLAVTYIQVTYLKRYFRKKKLM